jgi:predicted PurR-regulated permease PerM
MAAWGFTGMFKGAIILAITYTIFQAWANNAVQKEQETKIMTDNIEE